MRISTFTGRMVDLAYLRPEHVDIRDIAHGLSLLCRFNGQCRSFYSVAEHSLSAAFYCPPELRLQGLLHDAAEAYIGDIARPIKEALPRIAAIEEQIQHRILSAFGLAWWNGDPNGSGMHPVVREADDRLLATEARQLGVTLDREFEPFHRHRLLCLPPPQAEERFLRAFELLHRPARMEDSEELAILCALAGQPPAGRADNFSACLPPAPPAEEAS